MPITTLDPNAALVVIDLQKGLLGIPALHPLDEVIGRAGTLAAAFRRHGLPVVLVNAAGRPPGRTDQNRPPLAPPPGWKDIVPELGQADGDIAITKHASGAFGESPLAATLRERGVTQVVIVGVSTSNGVESTARQAYDLGFNVTVAIDAVTDIDAPSHNHAVTRIYPRIAETGLTAHVLALLADRKG